eukprot:5380349-Pleurochrysis_carterae.AAC.1
MTSNGSSNSLSAASAFMRDLPSSSNLCSQLKPAAERPKAPLPTVYYAKHQFTEPPPHQGERASQSSGFNLHPIVWRFDAF